MSTNLILNLSFLVLSSSIMRTSGILKRTIVSAEGVLLILEQLTVYFCI